MSDPEPEDRKSGARAPGEAGVSVTRVARNFADFLDRVAHGGEAFVLVRRGRPVARLSPVPRGARLGDLPDLLARAPSLDPDDAASLADDLSRAREELGSRPGPDPWAS